MVASTQSPSIDVVPPSNASPPPPSYAGVRARGRPVAGYSGAATTTAMEEVGVVGVDAWREVDDEMEAAVKSAVARYKVLAQREAGAVVAERSALREEIAALREECSALRDENASLRRSHVDNKIRHDKTVDELNAARIDLEDARGDAKTKAEAVHAVQTRLIDADREHALLQQRHREAEAELATLRAGARAHPAALAALRDKNKQLKARFRRYLTFFKALPQEALRNLQETYGIAIASAGATPSTAGGGSSLTRGGIGGAADADGGGTAEAGHPARSPQTVGGSSEEARRQAAVVDLTRDSPDDGDCAGGSGSGHASGDAPSASASVSASPTQASPSQQQQKPKEKQQEAPQVKVRSSPGWIPRKPATWRARPTSRGGVGGVGGGDASRGRSVLAQTRLPFHEECDDFLLTQRLKRQRRLEGEEGHGDDGNAQEGGVAGGKGGGGGGGERGGGKGEGRGGEALRVGALLQLRTRLKDRDKEADANKGRGGGMSTPKDWWSLSVTPKKTE